MAGADKQDAEDLARWCRTFLDFMVKEGQLSKSMHGHMEAAVGLSAKKGDAKALRRVQRDLLGMTRGLRKDVMARFEAALAGTKPVAPLASEVASILERGTVQTEEEYRLLSDRVEEIFQDPSKAAEVDAINDLLSRAKNLLPE